MPQKVRLHEFIVEGSGPFPVDMLRFDSCWPKRQEDVSTAFGSGEPRPRLPLRQVILTSSLKPPTIGRWQSFGWDVIEERKVY